MLIEFSALVEKLESGVEVQQERRVVLQMEPVAESTSPSVQLHQQIIQSTFVPAAFQCI